MVQQDLSRPTMHHYSINSDVHEDGGNSHKDHLPGNCNHYVGVRVHLPRSDIH